MARKSLDEIFGNITPDQQKSLGDIFGGVSAPTITAQPEATPERSRFQKMIGGLEKISGVGLGVAKGLPTTALRASQLGIKGFEKTTGLKPLGQPAEESIALAERGIEAIKPQTTSEKIGFTVEQIAELFVPVTKVGTAAKAPSIIQKGLTLLGRMTSGAVEFGGKKAIQTGGDAQEIKEAAIAGAIPFEKVLSPFARFLGGALKRSAGAITGKGVEVIDEILAAGKDALKGLKGESVKVLTDAAKAARDRVIQLDRQASAEYGVALEELPKRLGALPKVMQVGGKTTIKAGGKTYILSLQGVKAFITLKLKDVGVIVSRQKNFLDFTQSPLRTSEENILRDVFKAIDNWVDTSPKGLNNLAVKIGGFKAGEQSPLLNSIIGGIKKNVRDYIGFRVPAVKELNAQYAKSMDFIDALRTELSVLNNMKTTKGIIKVSRKIQNLFTSNKELVRNLIKEMEGGAEIIATEAGRQVAQAPSRAQSAIGDLVRNVIQTAIPPKAVGYIAAYTGIASQKIQPIVDVLGKFAPAERVALFTLFKDLMSDSQEDQE